jgi:two-component system nitrate/nitrite response regulator NarL
VGTVAIVHPREVWSAGIASLVRSCGFDVTGQWSKLKPALAQLLAAPPDILILSRRIVDESCKTVIGELRQRLSTIVVLEPEETLAAEDLRDFTFEGLLISDAPARVFETCLKTVAAGHGWIDPTFLRFGASPNQVTDWRCLSDRELEVARLAANGLSNKRIAKTLRVSDGTVKMHMHHILAKLHLERRGDLVLALMRSGSGLQADSAAAVDNRIGGKAGHQDDGSSSAVLRSALPKNGAHQAQQTGSAGECVD